VPEDSHSLKKGIRRASPIIFGYVPIAMAYGLMAQQAGLSVWVTAGMSVFVYAGASQFVAVSMFTHGYSPAVIIGTTFTVNFRHVLMSASLAPRMAKWSASVRAIFGALLTDESFALHSVHFANGDTDATAAVAMNTAAYLSWIAFGVVGHRLGALIEQPERWGLDFALPAMFIGLLMPSCSDRRAVTAAVSGGVVSVALYLAGLGRWAAFIGATAGATAGTFLAGGDADER
jgi:4-azaleucine resistance transporter AzlC